MKIKKYLVSIFLVLGLFLLGSENVYAEIVSCYMNGSCQMMEENYCINNSGTPFSSSSACENAKPNSSEGFTTNIEDELDKAGALGTYFKPTIGDYVSKGVGFVMIIGAVICLVMIVFGAITWITSEGDEKKLQDARRRITSAVIGLAILAASWAIWVLILHFMNLGGDNEFINLPEYTGRSGSSSSSGGTVVNDTSNMCNGGKKLVYEVGGPCCDNAKVKICGDSTNPNKEACTAGGDCNYMIDWSCCK